MLKCSISISSLVVAFILTAPCLAKADDLIVTQYKADPSGAPFAVSIEKGFFKKAGVEIEVISGEGGGTSVRNVIASALGYGETSPAGVIAAILEGQDIKIVNLGSMGGRHLNQPVVGMASTRSSATPRMSRMGKDAIAVR